MAKLKHPIDRAACRLLRDAINENCAQIAQELGVKITALRGNFSGGHVTFKVECALIGGSGEVHSKEADDFKLYADRHGLPVDALGKNFKHGLSTFKLIGYKPRASRFPIVAECVATGNRYKLPLWAVQAALGQRAVVDTPIAELLRR